jgi:Ca2+-binding RTX toxin-like protein
MSGGRIRRRNALFASSLAVAIALLGAVAPSAFATGSASVSGGVVTYTGTTGNDAIEVHQPATDQIQINDVDADAVVITAGTNCTQNDGDGDTATDDVLCDTGGDTTADDDGPVTGFNAAMDDGNDSIDDNDIDVPTNAQGGNGDDTLLGSTDAAPRNDNLDGGPSVDGDTVSGGSGDDVVNGGSGDDDLVDGGGGNDQVTLGSGDSGTALGDSGGGLPDPGNDTINLGGTSGFNGDFGEGDEGNDNITGSSSGQGGHTACGDTCFSSAPTGGTDVVNPGAGFDLVSGDKNNDTLILGGGDDFAFGDDLFGGFGGDRAGDGADSIDGGDGEDLMAGGGGNDSFAGGAGFDLVDYSFDSDIPAPGGCAPPPTEFSTCGANIVVSDLDGLAAAQARAAGDDGKPDENDTIGADVEDLNGDQDDDTLTGNNVSNVINGFNGNDTITGLAGGDALAGNNGNDTINARDGAANDRVNGGLGADRCIVDAGDDVTGCENVESAAVPPAVGDRTGPRCTVSRLRARIRRRAFFRRVTFRVRCNEPASLEVAALAQVRRVRGRLITSRVGEFVVAETRLRRRGGTRTVRLRGSRRYRRALGRRFRVRIRIIAADASGNRRTITRRVRVR